MLGVRDLAQWERAHLHTVQEAPGLVCLTQGLPLRGPSGFRCLLSIFLQVQSGNAALLWVFWGALTPQSESSSLLQEFFSTALTRALVMTRWDLLRISFKTLLRLGGQGVSAHP